MAQKPYKTEIVEVPSHKNRNEPEKRLNYVENLKI
jgi:hypothetical protein